MMQDWNSQRDSLLVQVGDYAKQTPDVLRRLMTIEDVTVKTSQLEPKIKPLFKAAGYIFRQENTPYSLQISKVLPSIKRRAS
ncbi:hypothetical protein [Marinomonas primoryensis]|uniref:hypothetical protein n=1 Tax=Marinomonas primoryensis TaxID=178399 RepID=UPI0019551E22|nr:hypothetical protein [Marinomonas primoryensis]